MLELLNTERILCAKRSVAELLDAEEKFAEELGQHFSFLYRAVKCICVWMMQVGFGCSTAQAEVAGTVKTVSGVSLDDSQSHSAIENDDLQYSDTL